MAAEAKYDMTVYPMTMAVRSASNGARAHLVQLSYCDCEDFTNRRGRLTEDGSVTICKHVREALERVGGWHREATPGPVIYRDVTRSRAAHVMTSSCLASSLVTDLLHAAVGTSPLSATADTTNGPVTVKYDGETRRYTVALPAAPVPEAMTYYRLTRSRAVTLLTSAYLAADLAEQLLLGARAAAPLVTTARIANGDVTVRYDDTNSAYDVTLPGAQPVALPANWPAETRG
jgi:hypothetical protein